MTGYLALTALLLLLSVLVLALHRAHRRTGTLPAVDHPDRERVDAELAAISAHADRPSGPARVIGLLAAAGTASPWHRASLGADEVDLAR